MLRKIFILVFFFAWISSGAQLYRQHITNFTPREYGQTNSLYTNAVVEDEQGLIYVGTAYGVLQYDGVNWRKIQVPSIRVTSLAVYKNQVFVGCQSEFGFLKSDAKGKLNYVSLSSKLPEREKSFSVIWKTLVWKDKIVFQADEKIFLYENQKVSEISPKTSFHLAFVEEEILYVRERETGLKQFDGKNFNLVKGGEQFSVFGIFAILPFQNSSKLIVTQEQGLWKWENESFSKIQISKDLENKLLESSIIGALKLSDGNIALYSAKNGIFILDKSLNLHANYSLSSGMRSSEVRDIFQDHLGNIWSATQKGVNRLQYSSPISSFSESSGLHGNVQSVGVLGKTILVGTSDGLFQSQENSAKSFVEISQIKTSVWTIEKTSYGLWIGTETGLWYFDGKNFWPINSSQNTALKYIREYNLLISGGKDGVFVYNASTKDFCQKIEDIKTDAYGMAYQILPDKSVEIWIGSKTMGVWQLKMSALKPYINQIGFKYSFDYSFENYFGQEDGLPQDWICAFQMEKNVVFGTASGLLKFISPEDIYKLSNDTTLHISDLRGYFDFMNFPKNALGKTITAFYSDGKTNLASLDFLVNSVSMSDSLASDFDFKTIMLGRCNTIEKFDNQLFIGGDDGLAIVRNSENKTDKYQVPNLLLRTIQVGKDTLWFGDQSYSGKKIVVPFSSNTVEIDLASSYFDNGFGPQYSWRIEGNDTAFSNWSNNPHIVFSNLTEGDYEIHFVAKNIHNQKSDEIVLQFSVLPPWYRSIWAYIIYGILAILFVYLLIQVNIRRLKEKNRKLEEIVKIRTQEVVEQKEEIEIQKNKIEEILHEIRSSISYARRIQHALLPSQDFLKTNFPNHFILFKPRDVVSGDFYWASERNKKVIISAADCTGHGVPGAFMSMLGMSLLNEIVDGKGVTEPAQILNILRKGIISALQQKGALDEQKDGMDISMISIDFEKNQLQWAGANNPLWIVRKTQEDVVELIEIKADKMPVAIHEKMPDFTNHSMEFFKGDRFFIFSDGFADQFGGEFGKKFMSKNLKNFFTANYHLNMNELMLQLHQTFTDWQGENAQVDDVTVIGVEV